MKTKYLILIFVMYSYLLPNLFSENIYYDSENEENNIFNNSNIPKKPSVFDYITDDNKLIYIIEKIDRYLENDGDINITNENGNTLLMQAVSIGYYDLADYLIEKKADISIFDLNKKYNIDSNTFLSKGKSTPFDGEEVFGECKMTIVGGKVVYNGGITNV